MKVAPFKIQGGNLVFGSRTIYGIAIVEESKKFCARVIFTMPFGRFYRPRFRRIRRRYPRRRIFRRRVYRRRFPRSIRYY